MVQWCFHRKISVKANPNSLSLHKGAFFQLRTITSQLHLQHKTAQMSCAHHKALLRYLLCSLSSSFLLSVIANICCSIIASIDPLTSLTMRCNTGNVGGQGENVIQKKKEVTKCSGHRSPESNNNLKSRTPFWAADNLMHDNRKGDHAAACYLSQ